MSTHQGFGFGMQGLLLAVPGANLMIGTGYEITNDAEV